VRRAAKLRKIGVGLVPRLHAFGRHLLRFGCLILTSQRCRDAEIGAAATRLACERFVSHVTGTVTRIGVDAREMLALEYALVLAAFMAGALASPLQSTPALDGIPLRQVDRAVTGTLEHHAHVRLRSVA
jgi:hypothetical protein